MSVDSDPPGAIPSPCSAHPGVSSGTVGVLRRWLNGIAHSPTRLLWTVREPSAFTLESVPAGAGEALDGVRFHQVAWGVRQAVLPLSPSSAFVYRVAVDGDGRWVSSGLRVVRGVDDVFFR